MLDTSFIPKQAELEDSQNYGLLREAGLQYIEKLAHKIWTDYNIHDPGVSLLELLCYAITDLGYRTDYDIKDLLTTEVNGEPVNKSFFHQALAIFPSNPVSFNDLRKLLIDITGIRNVWISKNENVRYCLDTVEQRLKNVCVHDTDKEQFPLNGLYDVLIEAEDFVKKDRSVSVGIGQADSTVGTFLTPAQAVSKGAIFKVRRELNLSSVTVFANLPAATTTANLVLDLFDADTNTLLESFPVAFNLTENNAGVETTIRIPQIDAAFALDEQPPLVELAPGNYRLAIQSTDVDLLNTPAADYPFGIFRVLDLVSGSDATNSDNGIYLLYDWKVSFAVSPIEQEALASAEEQKGQTGIANDTTLPAGGFIQANAQHGLRFHAFCPFQLKSVDIYAETTGTVTLSCHDRNNNPIGVPKVIDITDIGKTTLVLDWEIPTGLNNRIQIQGITNTADPFTLYRNFPLANVFPIEGNPAVEIFAGINGAGNDTDNLYYFLYNWQITYLPCPIQVSETTIPDLLLAARDRLQVVRNLCEDPMHIRHLKVEDIGICADIEVRPDVALEETLAEIYYQMELYVAPMVNFYTIDELLEKGKTTDQIFEGPILDHGFIDDDEFRKLERRCFLRTSDIIQIIMDVEGVTAVKSIQLLSFVNKDDLSTNSQTKEWVTLDGEQYWYQEEAWILHLQDLNFFAADFEPERSKVFFYKNGLPYLANPKRVAELLQEKKAKQVQRKLKGHDQNLPVPVGEFKDLEDYYPIQNDLPETYLVGQNRVPDRRSNLRKGQAKQLKAYLLFFEQVLANYFSQLSHIKELFSWEKTDCFKTYFTQKLQEITEIEELYIPDYAAQSTLGADGCREETLDSVCGQFENSLANCYPSEPFATKCKDVVEMKPEDALSDWLQCIMETPKVAKDRKNRFLDHLIGRFSESFSNYSLLMYSLFKEKAAARLILDKQAFLGDYPAVSAERGKAFDYRYPKRFNNLTGFQRRVYRLLGIHDTSCQVGRWIFSSPFIKIEKNGDTYCFIIVEYVDGTGQAIPIDELGFPIIDLSDPPQENILFKSAECSNREEVCILIDTLLAFGAKKDNWIYPNKPELCNPRDRWELRRKCDCDPSQPEHSSVEDYVLGYTTTEITTEEDFKQKVLCHFVKYADREGFHLIEHILLRKRTQESEDDFLSVELHDDGEDCDCVEVKDPYSFRATVLLPSWPRRFRSIRFRQYIENLLRLEAPAHVYLKICWINHCEMQEFEAIYYDWLEKHAALDEKFKGETLLPELSALTSEEQAKMTAYSSCLNALVKKIENLNNVFPVARLHDCDDIDGEEPQVSLNNTSLGSL